MGTALAWVLVRDRFWGKRLLDLVIDVPFALPTIVAGLVLLSLYGPKSPAGDRRRQHPRRGVPGPGLRDAALRRAHGAAGAGVPRARRRGGGRLARRQPADHVPPRDPAVAGARDRRRRGAVLRPRRSASTARWCCSRATCPAAPRSPPCGSTPSSRTATGAAASAIAAILLVVALIVIVAARRAPEEVGPPWQLTLPPEPGSRPPPRRPHPRPRRRRVGPRPAARASPPACAGACASSPSATSCCSSPGRPRWSSSARSSRRHRGDARLAARPRVGPRALPHGRTSRSSPVLINLVFGLTISMLLVRYDFPGKRLLSAPCSTYRSRSRRWSWAWPWCSSTTAATAGSARRWRASASRSSSPPRHGHGHRLRGAAAGDPRGRAGAPGDRRRPGAGRAQPRRQRAQTFRRITLPAIKWAVVYGVVLSPRPLAR